MSKLRLAAVIIVAACLPMSACARQDAPSAPTSGGHFHAGDRQREVVDAIAYRDMLGETRIVFSDTRYDRVAFARDGEIDLLDFMRHQGATLELQLDDEGKLRSISISSDGNQSMRVDESLAEAMQLTQRDDDHVAGRFALGGEHALHFDLPIHSGPYQYEPGVALPADGGAPGAALRAMVQAVHSGDLETLVANAPPEDAEQMRAAIDSGEAAAMLAMAQAFTPKEIEITGGREDGDRAWIRFSTHEDGAAAAGAAELHRQNGRWYVSSINTR